MKAEAGPYTLSSASFSSFLHPWLPIFMAGDGVAVRAMSISAWETARFVLLHHGFALSLSSGVGFARFTGATPLRLQELVQAAAADLSHLAAGSGGPRACSVQCYDVAAFSLLRPWRCLAFSGHGGLEQVPFPGGWSRQSRVRFRVEPACLAHSYLGPTVHDGSAA
jgi:hypothetical protein